MSTKFTVETATNEQWLAVLDYIFETEPSQLEVLADNANYNAFLDDGDIYYALEAGGVDNWSGYDEAIDLAEGDDNDWLGLSNSEKLDYLFAAGVDNWNWFSESIEESMHELFTTTRPSALNDATNGIVFLAKTVLKYSANWHNYVARKCEEYQNQN